MQGDAAGIAAQLAEGADPNEIEGGWFPLAGAAVRCDYDCLELLLNGGADPNQTLMETGRTAAMLCALMDIELGAAVQLSGGADEEDVIQAVDVSTAARFHQSIRCIVRKSSCRALHLLKTHGADLSMHDAAGDTCGTLAAGSADSQALALLCAFGIDMRRPNSRKETPLLLAAKRRSVGGVAVLLGAERTLQPERLEKVESMHVATGVDVADYVSGSQRVQLGAAPMRTLVELLCMAVQREHLPLCFLILREATFQRSGRKQSVLELLRLEDSYGLTALQHANYLIDAQARQQFTTLLTRAGADVCAELRVSRLDIPPVKKERGISLSGAIWFNQHITPDEARLPDSSEVLLQRLRAQAAHRPEDWTVRALRATYGQVQDRTALHFSALRSTTDKGGVWARILLEHKSPIVPDLFGSTALHIAAERLNVGALAAMLDAVGGTEDQSWGFLSLTELVNMEDHMHRTPLDLLYESRGMLESTLSDSYCACCTLKSRERRWTIFRRADVAEALDEMFATCGGFATKSAKNFRADDDSLPIHSFTTDHCITKRQFELYLQSIGVKGDLTDEIWQRDLAPSPDGASGTRGLNKMNRSQFGRAVHAIGRGASIFHDYIKLCDLAGHNALRIIDLLANVRTEGDTVQQRVDALLKDADVCEKLLLQNGAQSRSQRDRKRFIRRFVLWAGSPFAFIYGAAILATKPFFSTCQSLGELSAFPIHDEGHRGQQAAAAVFLVALVLGCWLLPLVAAMSTNIETRATMAVWFRMFFVAVVVVTQLLGLHRVKAENMGFFPDPAVPDGGPNPHLKGSKDNDASVDSFNAPMQRAESTRMGTAALMAWKIPSARYTELHGWFQDGEEGVKQASDIKLMKVTTDGATMAESEAEIAAEAGKSHGTIHLDNPYTSVRPRHTHLPVSARMWPFEPLLHNAKFVFFQLVEVIQLASLPVQAPDPGKDEHKWVPQWFSALGDFLRRFMLEFPEVKNMHTQCFFGAVAFCCVWAVVCGYMMLGLISRQRPELQNRLPAFSPDFVFRITFVVEFFVVGPCNMIVTKWLMRATDCTYVAEDQMLYYDLDPTMRCFEGTHTFRASLGAMLLILYTLTVANFGPSYIETWSDQKDIRVRPKFVAITSCVKLISVTVAVLLTRVQWAMVLYPVLGSLVLLYLSLREQATNIFWANRLYAVTYAALCLHSTCVALAWSLQDFTKEPTLCSNTESGGLVVETSIECIQEDEHPLAGAFRLLPTLLHQTGLILLFTICTISAVFCRARTKVEVIQAPKS